MAALATPGPCSFRPRSRWSHSLTPAVELMGWLGLLALLANLVCLGLLRSRREDDINMRSAWICSRNDVIGNVAVLVAAAGVALTGSAWPDIAVGLTVAGYVSYSAAQAPSARPSGRASPVRLTLASRSTRLALRGVLPENRRAPRRTTPHPEVSMPQQRYCAKTVFDSPSYTQGVKVSGPGTFLYISGQISQDAKGPAWSAAAIFPPRLDRRSRT